MKNKNIKTVVHLPTKEIFDKFFMVTNYKRPSKCGCKLDTWEAYRMNTCYDVQEKELGAINYYRSKIASFEAGIISGEDFLQNFFKDVAITELVEFKEVKA